MAIERKVAGTILQKDITLVIGTREYRVKRPTLRTMIEVSESISDLPKFNIEVGKEAQSSLAYAKYCRPIGRIFATVICSHGILLGLRRFFVSKRIISRHTPTELSSALQQLVIDMQVADFFVLTTSLNEINLIRPTMD